MEQKLRVGIFGATGGRWDSVLFLCWKIIPGLR